MSVLSPARDKLLDDPFYPRLKRHVVELTGIAYYADKDLDFARRVGHRLDITSRADCASYFELLGDPLRGPQELDHLIAEITIGETYFFRHQEHFDALREHVFPDLISRNRLTRSLRIWCAGCADGPEPYSVAILLKREMAEMLDGWEMTILATDINRLSLARAREGCFDEWALRSTPEDLRRHCFSKDKNLWRVKPEYQKAVTFEYHNLATDPFPGHSAAFDLIVCRNVMIYFGAERMEGIVRQFRACLAPGAWLLVGPSEPNMTYFTSFRALNLPGLTLYQKPCEQKPCEQKPGECEAKAGATRGLVIAPFEDGTSAEETAPCKPVSDCENVRPTSSLPTSSAVGSSAKGPDIEAGLAKARAHGDRGDWEEARRCCEDLLVMGGLNSRVHLYRGLVLEQMKKLAEAEQSLRSAIYLDRQSALAHYYLGSVLEAAGRRREAARCFENTLRLLDGLSQAISFPDADGITADELRSLAAMHFEILSERVCNVPI